MKIQYTFKRWKIYDGRIADLSKPSKDEKNAEDTRMTT